MKIVFFARRFYPDIGGVEKHVLRLSKELIKKGQSVFVIAEKSHKDTSESFVYEGIHVYKIAVGRDDWFKKFRIWKGIWKLRKIILAADIVHCHDVFFWYLPYRFLFPTKRVFMTFHGYEGYPIARKAILVRKLSEKLTWGNICIGEFITKWYGTKADYLSYGAVDVDTTQKIISTNVQKESALFYGRLDSQTGIKTYIDAFKIVQKKHKQFSFCIVGDGELKKIVPQEAIYKAFQNNPEMYFNHYRFAFLSRYLSILEAFAAKRLVFAVYDNPLKKDYLQMTPYVNWIVTAKDARELSEKVVYYLENPKKEKEMIDQASHWVTEQTWEKMANLYLELWKKA